MRMYSERLRLSENGREVFEDNLRALRAENEKKQHADEDDFLYFVRKKRGETAADAEDA